MPPSGRHQQPLRLPHKVAEQLRRQAGRDGVSVNAYVLRAVKAQLRADGVDTERERDTPKRDRDRDAPQGLGLSRTRRPEPELLPTFEEEAPAPAPVVVNVGGAATAASEGSLLEGLAAFVMNGPLFSRDQRKRTALDVLKATPGERDQLAQQLEALLETKKAQQARPSFGTAIGSLFR